MGIKSEHYLAEHLKIITLTKYGLVEIRDVKEVRKIDNEILGALRQLEKAEESNSHDAEIRRIEEHIMEKLNEKIKIVREIANISVAEARRFGT
jgi:hypothetical protein